jgi:hypothetical protein
MSQGKKGERGGKRETQKQKKVWWLVCEHKEKGEIYNILYRDAMATASAESNANEERYERVPKNRKAIASLPTTTHGRLVHDEDGRSQNHLEGYGQKTLLASADAASTEPAHEGVHDACHASVGNALADDGKLLAVGHIFGQAQSCCIDHVFQHG